MAKPSKNNPETRSKEKLEVYCADCMAVLKTVKIVSSGGKSAMVYKCYKCGFVHPCSAGSYQQLKFDWVAK